MVRSAVDGLGLGQLGASSLIRYIAALLILSLSFSAVEATASQAQVAVPATLVRQVLGASEADFDYLRAAIAFEKLIAPASDATITEATVARLVDAAHQMAGPNPTDAYKLAAIRKAIYGSGAWNYDRAFSYDLDDPLGQKPQNRLLSTYIETRKGNCVSMPILFLIVADRMGLKVSLATAPLHIFVRYTDPQGVEHNLETTSGGRAARTEWYRQNLPMSDRAIANGIYMRTLSRRESIATMANTTLEFLIQRGRYAEAIEVADAILAANPRDAHAMVKKGSAYAGLLQQEFIDKYPTPPLIPPTLRSRYRMLAHQNEKAFKDAGALGWEPPK